jgi:hypothetical protein
MDELTKELFPALYKEEKKILKEHHENHRWKPITEETP